MQDDEDDASYTTNTILLPSNEAAAMATMTWLPSGVIIANVCNARQHIYTNIGGLNLAAVEYTLSVVEKRSDSFTQRRRSTGSALVNVYCFKLSFF